VALPLNSIKFMVVGRDERTFSRSQALTQTHQQRRPVSDLMLRPVGLSLSRFMVAVSPMKGGTTHGQSRFADVQSRPPIPGFHQPDPRRIQQLLPPSRRRSKPYAAWRLDGKPRRPASSPCTKLPPADAGRRLFFLLTYVKTCSLQVVQGRLFGWGRAKPIRDSHPAPCAPRGLTYLGDAPTRSLTDLRSARCDGDRCGPVVAPLAEEFVPLTTAPAVVPASPLLPMTTRATHRPPQGAAQQTTCYSGKKKDHVKMSAGRCAAHDPFSQRDAEACFMISALLRRPVPLPPGSRLLQDLGFLAFTLPTWRCSCRRRNPVPGAPVGEQRANQALHPASVTDRAFQQQRQALSYRERPHPPVEGGRPRSCDGTLCPA